MQNEPCIPLMSMTITRIYAAYSCHIFLFAVNLKQILSFFMTCIFKNTVQLFCKNASQFMFFWYLTITKFKLCIFDKITIGLLCLSQGIMMWDNNLTPSTD